MGELSARLDHLQLLTEVPERLVAFYGEALGMTPQRLGESDDLAARGIGLVWGPGRHGPGNNLFIMVRDPDDNLIEFSAELEVISNDRPARVWPQAESTFNLWGSASLRA